MPKPIQNAERNILLVAEQMFFEKGYDATEMRDIAATCHIAVGTLYNYYATKTDLFDAVYQKSLVHTLAKIDILLDQDLYPKLKIYGLIEILYDSTIEKMSIWVEKFRLDLNRSMKSGQVDLNRPIGLDIGLLERIGKLIHEVRELEKIPGDNEEDIRLGRLLLDAVTVSLIVSPTHRQENIRFLHTIINKLVG